MTISRESAASGILYDGTRSLICQRRRPRKAHRRQLNLPMWMMRQIDAACRRGLLISALYLINISVKS